MSVALYEELSKERKEAQAAGAAPDWMITGGYNLWRDRLRYKDETFRDSVDRVASEAAVWAFPLDKERRSISDLTRRFFDIIWDNWLCPATTTLANLGTDRGLPVSCSGNYVGDSVDEFYKAFHEVAMLTKTGVTDVPLILEIFVRGEPHIVTVRVMLTESSLLSSKWYQLLPTSVREQHERELPQCTFLYIMGML